MGNATNTMTRFLTSFLRIGAAMIVLVGLSAGTAMGQDLFVDPGATGANDGSSASDAYTSLADAIADANDNTTGTFQGGYPVDISVEPAEYPGESDGAFLASGDPIPPLGEDADFQLPSGTSEGTVVLNSNFSVGDTAGNFIATLSLESGFTLEFEENRVLTLTGEDATVSGNTGSVIGGEGQLLISTASGTFTINIERDNPAGTNELRATIQNLVVDKSGGTVEVVRTPQDPNLTADLAVSDASRGGGASVGVAGFAGLDVQAGALVLGGNNLLYIADTGTDSNPTDPAPVLNVDENGAVEGDRTLTLDVSGQLGFEATGTGSLDILLNQVSAPVNTGSQGNGDAGTTINFSSIGNGGNSTVASDTLNAPNLTDIQGSLTAENPDTFVEAPALENVTSDLDVADEASVVVGGSAEPTVEEDLTVTNDSQLEADSRISVNGDTDIAGGGVGSSTLILDEVGGEFGGTFTIGDASTARFGNASTFNNLTVNSSGTNLTFQAPGAIGASQVNGKLTFNDGTIDLADDTGNDNGLHDLEINGDAEFGAGATFNEGNDSAPPRATAILFADPDGDAQDIELGAGATTQINALITENSAELSGDGTLLVSDSLRLEGGVLNTNGLLDAGGIKLVRVRNDDGHGELFRGDSDLAYINDTAVPTRIEYQGTRNIATGDELLPAGLDASVREIPELAVNMENIDAVVTLGVNYTVTRSAEILAGNLSLGSATLSLFNQSTFVRGDGELDPGPVPPEDALIFPDTPDELGVGSEFDVGSDGIDLEYVNEEGPVTTGIEFPTNDRDSDLIRDLTVESGAPVNLRDGSTYRVNQDIALNDGTLDLSGQTLQHNGGGSVNYNHEAELADTGDEGLFQFIGDDTDATVAGTTDDESGTIFPFPTTEVAKDDSSTVTFNVTDNNNSGMEDPNDGYAFNGDFTIAAAQNFDGTGDGDGIDQPNDGVTFSVDGNDGTDVLSVDGNFVQNAGSFLAEASSLASFEVTGNLTKAASDTSRFDADSDEFTVGGNVTQESGTFKVEDASTFTVGGDLQNNSPDALDFDDFDSDAFEVSTPATFSVGGTLSQSAGNFEVTGSSSSEASLSISENYEQDGGTATINGFAGSDASVSIGDSYTQEGGTAEIPDATLLSVENDVSVTAGTLEANLSEDSGDPTTPPNNVFEASTLTVGDSTDASGGPGGDFTDGQDATLDVAPNSSGADNDAVEITGDVSVGFDAQLALRGQELRTGGDFEFLGAGDALVELPGNDPEESGLVGTVRFVGSETQTLETDETPDTYLNGLAVDTEGEADLELASNVSTNQKPGAFDFNRDYEDGDDPDQRNFGTVALESGDIVTGEDTLNVLQPDPTSGGDLAQAVNADERSADGTVVDQTPVLGGTRNSHVVGTLRRALEQQNSTGGFVQDGYIYPLGTGDTYEAAVVQPPTDLGDTGFVTVTITDAPDAELTPFETPGVDPSTNTLEEFTLDINQLSGPFWNVNFDEEPDEDLNVRAIASDLDSRAEINDIKQMRIVQLNESESSWQLAGIYDFTRDANDDRDRGEGGGPNSFISGVPNIIHEGVDFRQGTVIGLASDRNINPLGTGDAGVEIAGTVTYPTVSNGSLAEGRALEGVTVEASSSDTTATATTDADGNYAIGGLPAGDYDVEATVSDSVENVQTADALRAVRGFAGIDAFAGPFQEQVADVNGSGNVNATDALLIAQFVLGNVDGFDVGAFVTESESVTLENGSSADVTLFAAEAGDVRLNGGETGSSEAALASSTISPKTSTGAVATQSSSQSSSVDAEAGKTFEVPVRIDRSTTVGAYQMAFDFPSEKASFEGIKGTAQDVLTNASDGTVKVSWFDQSGESALDLQSGSELVTLRFKAADDVDGVEFAPEVTSGEIAGADATPLSAGVEIQAVRIGAPAPDEFALNGSYPNPVRSQATLNMDLPSRTDVTVEVYNVLGQRVQTMERTMSAGAGQTIKLDGSKFASGQYFYRVKANFEGETAQETGRITVVK